MMLSVYPCTEQSAGSLTPLTPSRLFKSQGLNDYDGVDIYQFVTQVMLSTQGTVLYDVNPENWGPSLRRHATVGPIQGHMWIRGRVIHGCSWINLVPGDNTGLYQVDSRALEGP